jgi:hypothetical protein
VASATDGLAVEMSSDGVTWYSGGGDLFTIGAATQKTFSIQPHTKFYRVKYTNGGTNQTTFDLQTVLKKQSSLASSHRIQDSITDDDDAELVKAVLTGSNPAGNFVNFQSTTAGNFKVSLEELESGVSVNSNSQLKVTPYDSSGNEITGDPYLAISRGLYSGFYEVNKYGKATDGVQTTPTDIWDRADATPTQQIWLAPTAARIHAIVSSSTADDGTPEGAGAGAQAVRIWGLTSWSTAETSEDVILNGTSPVNTSNSYVIIHRMKVIEVGSTYNINTGNITATAATDGTVTAQISASQGQTLMAIYGIPSTQKAYMTCYNINAHDTSNPSQATEVDFTLLVNERPDLNPLTFLNKSNPGTISTGTTTVNRCYRPYFGITGPAIIKFQATSTAADTEGVAEFDLILVDN